MYAATRLWLLPQGSLGVGRRRGGVVIDPLLAVLLEVLFGQSAIQDSHGPAEVLQPAEAVGRLAAQRVDRFLDDLESGGVLPACQQVDGEADTVLPERHGPHDVRLVLPDAEDAVDDPVDVLSVRGHFSSAQALEELDQLVGLLDSGSGDIGGVGGFLRHGEPHESRRSCCL